MPNPKSETVKHMDAVQAAVHSFLKPLGFRKKGRTHNRETGGKLVHVVNFQMGDFPIGEYVIPGLRESYYGKFTVNLGILLPCVPFLEWHRQFPDFVREYNCTIRSRLSTVAYGNDNWFELSEDTATLATTVVGLLDQFGLNFFEPLQSYEDALRYYKVHDDLSFQCTGRASLEAALVAKHLGREALAAKLFATAYATDHKAFRQYVATLATRIGVPIEQ
jgi:hypothetical protein